MKDTRQKILDAALDLFTERGYDKVTLQEIADRVGVTKAALYYYFQSKETILETLMEPFLEIHDRFHSMFTSTPTRESWAKGLAAFVKWALPQRRLFELAQSNHTAFQELMRRPENDQRHVRLHERIDVALADESVALEDRVRMAGASTLLMGIFAFPAGSTFARVPADLLAPIVIEAIADVLQVDPRTLKD
jgi:AcrR family transcriptional regulator